MKSILITTVAVLVATLLAQAQPEKNVGSVEIDVVDQYKASVKKAAKISNQPDFVDTTTKKLPVQYRIYPELLNYTFTPEPIKPVKVQGVKLGSLPKNMAKLGGGMYGTSLAEVLLSSSRAEAFNWEVGLNHFGTQKGVKEIAFAKSPMMENTLFLGGRWVTKDYRLSSKIGADWNRYHYYGLPASAYPEGKQVPDLQQNDYQRYFGQVDFDRIYRLEKSIFEGAGVGYHYFANNWQTTEHLLNIGGRLQLPQEVKANKLGAALNMQWFKNTQQDTATNSQINVQFFPKAKGKYAWFSYTAGINFNFYNTTLSRPKHPDNGFQVFIYPEIIIGAELVRDALGFFAGWTGNVTTNSQYSLGLKNPYVLPGVYVVPTGLNKIYAGLEGAIARQVSYKAEANMRVYNNLPLFVRSGDSLTLPYNNQNLPAFETRYADGGIFQVRGELSYKGTTTNISAFGELNGYNLKIGEDETPYHLPKLRIGADVRQSIKEKFDVKAGLAFVGGRQALATDGLVYTANMKDVWDAHLGVGYNINNNLSTGLELTNLISQQYEVWLGYPAQRFRALVYLMYKF